MRIVKNINQQVIRHYEGFEVREDLNFRDDGNYFRGYAYKGMPITTLRADGTTYLAVRVDYLDNNFTTHEWLHTPEYYLAEEFNGVAEVDMDKLVENLEKIIAKVAELNANAEAEVIDTDAIQTALDAEVAYAEQVVEDFKHNFKWYEVSSYKLNQLADYLKSQERENARCKAMKISEQSVRIQRDLRERLNKYGYVMIRKDSFYLEQMLEAMSKEVC